MNWTIRNIMWLNGVRVFGLQAGEGGRFQRFHDRALARSQSLHSFNRFKRMAKYVMYFGLVLMGVGFVTTVFGAKDSAGVPPLVTIIGMMPGFFYMDLVLIHEGLIAPLVHDALSWDYRRRREWKAAVRQNKAPCCNGSTKTKRIWPWPYTDVVMRSFLIGAVVAGQLLLPIVFSLPATAATPTTGGIDLFMLIPLYVVVTIVTCAAVYVWSWKRIKSATTGNHCFGCEYDLGDDDRLAAQTSRCPECGLRFPYWNQFRILSLAEPATMHDPTGDAPAS